MMKSRYEWHEPKMKSTLNTFAWANKDRLPGFKELLESWLNVNQRYCDGIWPEYPWDWDFKERTQIGLLSNAAILTGAIALEEWGTQKKSDDENKRHGRTDLWLRLCPPSNERDYYIEAKHGRIDLQKPISVSEQIVTQIMAKAETDAGCLDPKGGKAIAISFFTLRFTGKKIGSLDNKLRELLAHMEQQNKQTNNWDAMAWVWSNAERFDQSRIERQKIWAPWTTNEAGLILIAKLC